MESSQHIEARAGAPGPRQAEVRQLVYLGCFRRGSAVNRCGCGNAVARGSGHCRALGGDVRTEPGGLSGWLSSKLTGCFGDVGGSTTRLGVARSRVAACCFFYLLLTGIFLPWKGERERSQKGIPSTMEPRIAGSVSTNSRHPGQPSGDGAWYCWNHTSTFPGSILLMGYRSKITQLKKMNVISVFLRVGTMFELIVYCVWRARPQIRHTCGPWEAGADSA